MTSVNLSNIARQAKSKILKQEEEMQKHVASKVADEIFRNLQKEKGKIVETAKLGWNSYRILDSSSV